MLCGPAEGAVGHEAGQESLGQRFNAETLAARPQAESPRLGLQLTSVGREAGLHCAPQHTHTAEATAPSPPERLRLMLDLLNYFIDFCFLFTLQLSLPTFVAH